MYEVTIKKTFSAAHMLTEVGGTCEKLHGHNFIVEVSVCSESLNGDGILIDFRVLKQWMDDLLKEFDHKYLNEIRDFKEMSPSAENIARLIYDRIFERTKKSSLKISRVTLWESEDARVTYY